MSPELRGTFFLLNNKSNFTTRGSPDADDLYWSSSPLLSTDQRNGNDNKMLTYENSTYGIHSAIGIVCSQESSFLFFKN